MHIWYIQWCLCIWHMVHGIRSPTCTVWRAGFYIFRCQSARSVRWKTPTQPRGKIFGGYKAHKVGPGGRSIEAEQFLLSDMQFSLQFCAQHIHLKCMICVSTSRNPNSKKTWTRRTPAVLATVGRMQAHRQYVLQPWYKVPPLASSRSKICQSGRTFFKNIKHSKLSQTEPFCTWK